MPTKEELVHTYQQDAFEAALEALESLRPGRSTDRHNVARMVIHAYNAAEMVLTKGMSELERLFPGDNSGAETDSSSVVGAAFWAKMTGADSMGDEIHPNCGGSESMLGYAKAIQLLETAAQLDYIAEYDTSATPHSSSHALAALDRQLESPTKE